MPGPSVQRLTVANVTADGGGFIGLLRIGLVVGGPRVILPDVDVKVAELRTGARFNNNKPLGYRRHGVEAAGVIVLSASLHSLVYQRWLAPARVTVVVMGSHTVPA